MRTALGPQRVAVGAQGKGIRSARRIVPKEDPVNRPLDSVERQEAAGSCDHIRSESEARPTSAIRPYHRDSRLEAVLAAAGERTQPADVLASATANAYLVLRAGNGKGTARGGHKSAESSSHTSKAGRMRQAYNTAQAATPEEGTCLRWEWDESVIRKIVLGRTQLVVPMTRHSRCGCQPSIGSRLGEKTAVLAAAAALGNAQVHEAGGVRSEAGHTRRERAGRRAAVHLGSRVPRAAAD